MILYLYPSEKNLVSVNSNPPPTGRHMSHAKKLIVTANTPSANTSRMLDAVARGANIESIDLQVIAPDVLQPEDLISSNGLILGTTENLGYMAGTIKDIFDRCYYPCLEKTQGLPFAYYIRAGHDGVITPFLASPKSRAYAAISGGLPPLALWGRR